MLPPALMLINHPPAKRAWTLPLAGPRRRLGRVLCSAGDFLFMFLAIVLTLSCGLLLESLSFRCGGRISGGRQLARAAPCLRERERELDSREGAITAWENGLVAFVRAL
jgi:hypothetical protein